MKATIRDPGNARFVDIAGKLSKGKPALLAHGGKVYRLALLDESDLEELAVAKSRKFRQIIEKSRASVRAGRGIPAEEVRKTLKIR